MARSAPGMLQVAGLSAPRHGAGGQVCHFWMTEKTMPANNSEPFSIKYGYRSENSADLVREDAPEQFRIGLLDIFGRQFQIGAASFREIVCGVLRVNTNPNNWSSEPVWDEAKARFLRCDWFRVFDVVEAVVAHFSRNGGLANPDRLEQCINRLMVEDGIGWKVEKGGVLARGEGPFEQVVTAAEQRLGNAKMPTAHSELGEAIKDLSRRPAPDLSGAVQHAMTALECVAKMVTNQPKEPLGQLIGRRPDLFPRPMGDAVQKMWGYASNEARHGNENRNLAWGEAQLIVGIAAVCCSYLLEKARQPTTGLA